MVAVCEGKPDWEMCYDTAELYVEAVGGYKANKAQDSTEKNGHTFYSSPEARKYDEAALGGVFKNPNGGHG